MSTVSRSFMPFLMALVLLALPAAAATNNTTPPARDDGVRRDLTRDQKLKDEEGGGLTRFTSNVLVDRHNECRWLDNNNAGTDYFVPTGKAEDWTAFINNAPNDVRLDRCCPPSTVTLTSSDGQVFNFNLSVGRENSTGDFGIKKLSHTFEVTDAGTGATYSELVNEDFICQNKQWTGQGTVRTGSPGGWFAEPWGACSASCEGVQTRSVVCKDPDGNVVADSLCGGAKPSTSQACGESSCAVTGGNCTTYIQSISNHPGCSQDIVDKRVGRACSGPDVTNTEDLAMCTITTGCACEETIYAGCFVDTQSWDSFNDGFCTSSITPTQDDGMGNRTATFSVGTHAMVNPYGHTTSEMVYFPNNTGRYRIQWSGDCDGSASVCGGKAPGAKGRVVLNSSVTVIDTYLDKTHTFDVQAEVNTILCGYSNYPPCPGGGLDAMEQ